MNTILPVETQPVALPKRDRVCVRPSWATSTDTEQLISQDFEDAGDVLVTHMRHEFVDAYAGTMDRVPSKPAVRMEATDQFTLTTDEQSGAVGFELVDRRRHYLIHLDENLSGTWQLDDARKLRDALSRLIAAADADLRDEAPADASEAEGPSSVAGVLSGPCDAAGAR